ncbi:TPA: phage tail protein [Escherichia coli]|uniref:phage tail protein n=1 Tax=Escherichia coli TaxID=562 RepID=UPI0010CC49C2|nr:phage tail protein [Escherichia coli]EHW5886097.1 phage tail protein [Escherichia coli]GCZ73196.1 phage tail protein [Escherichia coli]HAJ2181041.1 phage tail protein [Escherichia coli]HAJ2395170.1 phage tail protein [Escherichia coli]HDS9868322.1 phage tail protein [Escherichia coli]
MAAKKDDIMNDEIVAEDTAVESTETAEEKTGVQLSCPVVRGERVIDYVEIGEEIRQAGSLRGLSLIEVLNLKTDPVMTLLSRVTAPRLKLAEIQTLDTGDFVALATLVANFLAPTESAKPSVAVMEA